MTIPTPEASAFPPATTTVFVTGANGFIASHVITQLLAQGYKVKATVRSLSNAAASAHLTGLPKAAENLTLVAGDLLTAGVFDEPMKGCQVCLHLASPYVLEVKDAQKDLVDPAVMGTKSVLQSAATAHVKVVVVTSSLAAIAEAPAVPHRTYTEEDWNSASTLKHNPYYFSKRKAEEAAWEFHKALSGDAQFELITLLPGIVLGPSLTAAVNTSVGIIQDLATGKYPFCMPISFIPAVDVRDVASAHIRAFQVPNLPHKRMAIISSSDGTFVKDMVAVLKPAYPKYKWPAAFSGPTMLTRVLAYTLKGSVRTYILANTNGQSYSFDNSKAVETLGMAYKSHAEMWKDTVEDLIHWKHI